MINHSLNWLRCDTGAKITTVTAQHSLHLVENISGQRVIFVASSPPLMITAPRGHVQIIRLVLYCCFIYI